MLVFSDASSAAFVKTVLSLFTLPPLNFAEVNGLAESA
jgi:hypothetical protein